MREKSYRESPRVAVYIERHVNAKEPEGRDLRPRGITHLDAHKHLK